MINRYMSNEKQLHRPPTPRMANAPMIASTAERMPGMPAISKTFQLVADDMFIFPACSLLSGRDLYPASRDTMICDEEILETQLRAMAAGL